MGRDHVIGMGLPLYIRKLLPDWPRAKDKAGVLHISAQEIKVDSGNTQTIGIDEIEKMEILSDHYSGYDGKDRITHHGMGMFMIKMNNGEEYNIKCLLENPEDKASLGAILRQWYKEKIPLKEYLVPQHTRALLMEDNWKYEELQELKKELGIEGLVV